MLLSSVAISVFLSLGNNRLICVTAHGKTLPHQYYSQLTGADALNDTTVVDVKGADLGIIVKHQESYYYIFGDTFGCGSGLAFNWRSNTMAYSSDTDPSDGILLQGWIVDPFTKNASELIHSKKIDYVEKTCIPTTAFSYDGKMFVYYMSVKHWYETGGCWDSNNASIAVSLDNGKTFTKMSNISWVGEGNFIQFGWAQSNNLSVLDGYLYLLAAPSGRFKACYLCRVPFPEILNQLSYEYYSGLDDDGAPQWHTSVDDAQSIFPLPIGDISVMWNNYLQKWTVFYTDNIKLSINIRFADNLWGPWSAPYKIVDAYEYPSLYGSFVHPDLIENDGEKVYFIMSIFNVYNAFVMSVNLSSLKNITPTSPFGFTTTSLLLIGGLTITGFLLNARINAKKRSPYKKKWNIS